MFMRSNRRIQESGGIVHCERPQQFKLPPCRGLGEGHPKLAHLAGDDLDAFVSDADGRL